MCQRLLLIDFSLKYQNSSKRSDKTTEAHNIWPRIARVKALPENIRPTVTGAYRFLRAAWRPLPSIKHPIDPKKLINWWKPTRPRNIFIFIDETILQALTYNGWSNVIDGKGTLSLLLWSVTNDRSEYNAVASVACRFLTGSIVIIDFVRGWSFVLRLLI